MTQETPPIRPSAVDMPKPRRSTADIAPSSRLVRRIPGSNGNSRRARRFRQIAVALATDLGGEATLSESLKLRIRHAAAVSVELEAMQEMVIKGEAIDTEQLVRLANVHSRALKDIGIKGVPEPKELTLGEYLAAQPRGERP